MELRNGEGGQEAIVAGLGHLSGNAVDAVMNRRMSSRMAGPCRHEPSGLLAHMSRGRCLGPSFRSGVALPGGHVCASQG